MYVFISFCMYVCMYDVWMDGWMDVWMCGRMDVVGRRMDVTKTP